jgi:hypothetical protein
MVRSKTTSGNLKQPAKEKQLNNDSISDITLIPSMLMAMVHYQLWVILTKQWQKIVELSFSPLQEILDDLSDRKK